MYFEAWLRACGRDVNGYPWLAPRLTNRCTNHEDLHVRGHNEEGTTSTLANNGTLATMPVACPSKAGAPSVPLQSPCCPRQFIHTTPREKMEGYPMMKSKTVTFAVVALFSMSFLASPVVAAVAGGESMEGGKIMKDCKTMQGGNCLKDGKPREDDKGKEGGKGMKDDKGMEGGKGMEGHKSMEGHKGMMGDKGMKMEGMDK